MSESTQLLDQYLIFKESEVFAALDEESLLAFLQLGRTIKYSGHSLILKEGTEMRYVFAFLEGLPLTVELNRRGPAFWGLEALVTPYTNPSDLVAPSGGTRALVFPVPRLIAFLNEAPDVLIGLLKQTTKT